MLVVDSGNSAVGAALTGAIRKASQATGTSFRYLLATARVESGLEPDAGASTSTARGLFQFVEQTWLGMIKQAGALLGYGRYAAAITKTASGHYEVKNPALRGEVLGLRNDPTANAVMAGAFTKANQAYLTQHLGRPPSEGELYIAHFLGAGGAARLIMLAASHPDAKAADFFAKAAHANPSIFFDRGTGAARSLAAVRDILIHRYDVARSRPNGPAAAALTQAQGGSALPLGAPDTAGITGAFAAATPPPPPPRPETPLFQRLFQDGSGNMPVAAVVSRLWSVPGSTPSPPAPPAASPTAAGFLDLFQDIAERS